MEPTQAFHLHKQRYVSVPEVPKCLISAQFSRQPFEFPIINIFSTHSFLITVVHVVLEVDRLMEGLDICQISCKKTPTCVFISHLCPLSACICLSQTLTLTLEPLQMNFGLGHMTHIRHTLIYYLLSTTLPDWIRLQSPQLCH